MKVRVDGGVDVNVSGIACGYAGGGGYGGGYSIRTMQLKQ